MPIFPEMEIKIPLIKILTTALTTLTNTTQIKKPIAAGIDLFPSS
jgi:hypothetical protein